MKLTLITAKVQETIRKNTSTSYGLTLVIGFPFPPEICRQIQYVQQQLDALAPGQFTWYGLEHLHATLLAPLRGQYRDAPPLQRQELPANFRRFTQDLTKFFTQQQPFSIEWSGVHLSPNGFVLVAENTLAQQLASRLQSYPELDRPKFLKGLHLALGFLNTSQPFATQAERNALETVLPQLATLAIGSMQVRQVWLVHYANRTLNRIIGKIPLTLDQPNALTAEQMLRALGIAVS